MYEQYWNLSQPPFENGANGDFYYPSEGHQAALLKLRYAIENRKGAGLLAGDRGAGKTMVIEMLRRQLPETFRPLVHLVFPQMPPADMLAWLAAELAGDESAPGARSIDASIRSIRRSLDDNTERGRHAVVVIDEAHLVDDTCWETLRLLLNFETDGRRDLTLLLVGQFPLISAIERMPSWEERLAVKCLLKPLTAEETACYVQHRLRAAGCEDDVFSPEAVSTLHRASHGFPRRINRLCDLALVVGFAEQLPVIGQHEVEAISQELSTTPLAE